MRRITKVDPNEALDKPNDPKTVRSPSSLSSSSRPRSRADRGSALPVQFLLLSGVNHALFGKRDAKQCVPSSLPSLSPFPRLTLPLALRRYGTTTLAQIEERITKLGKELGVEIVCAQTDYEGEMCQLVRPSSRLGSSRGSRCGLSLSLRPGDS